MLIVTRIAIIVTSLQRDIVKLKNTYSHKHSHYSKKLQRDIAKLKNTYSHKHSHYSNKFAKRYCRIGEYVQSQA